MMVWRALGGLGSNSKPLTLRSKNQRFVLCCGIFYVLVVLNFVYGRGWSVMGVVVG